MEQSQNLQSSAPPVAPAPDGRLREAFMALRGSLSATIVGQQLLVDRLLIALLADGHLLVEGAPAWPRPWRCVRWPRAWKPASRACSSRPTYCRPI